MDTPEPTADARHDERPNIILLTAHDMGRELGCYGSQAHTPEIDRLAEESAVFENHFVASPTCHPSRASLNTGLYPHNNGMFGHGVLPTHPQTASGRFNSPKANWSLHDAVPTLTMFLNDRGYRTYLRGDDGFEWGEDSYELNEKARGARHVADDVETVLTDEASDDQPFFIRANTHNAHHPYSTRDGGFKDDPIPGYEGPTAEDVDLDPLLTVDESEVEIGWGESLRENVQALYEDIYEFDYAVGQILDALEATNQRENTVVIVTTDHGISFPGEGLIPKAKLTNYERGIEAALLVNYPDRIETGHYDEMLSNVDLLPTILDLVDGRPPYDVDGRSFRPLVDNTDPREYSPREVVYSENTYFGDGYYTPERAIRSERYKLIRHFWPNWLPDSNPEVTTEVELYDLETDPEERENVAEDPRYFEIREQLYDRLRDRLISDDDPIVHGQIPPQTFDTDV